MQVIKISVMQIIKKKLYILYHFFGSFERCVPSNKGVNQEREEHRISPADRKFFQNIKELKGIPK